MNNLTPMSKCSGGARKLKLNAGVKALTSHCNFNGSFGSPKTACEQINAYLQHLS